MTIVSPSLLSANFLNLKDDIDILNQSANLWLHLDIMDGHFVPNLTFGVPVLKNLAKASKHKLDAHLMVLNPEQYIEGLASIGVHNFTFHWEAVTHHDRLIQLLKTKFSSVGISLNPSTPVSAIPEYLLKEINLILIMSVNPGFGGQSFIEASIEKVKQLNELKKKLNLHFEIQVDGGVSDKNAKTLTDSGATNLVAGSFIFKGNDYNEQINLLRN